MAKGGERRKVKNFPHEETWLREFVSFHGTDRITRFCEDDLGGVSLTSIFGTASVTMNEIMQHDLAGSGPVAGHYHAKSIGSPFEVYLTNGFEITPDPASGKMMTSITDLPGLMAAIVQSRVSHPRKLSGADLKFIRSALCLQSKALARALELTPEHYSRCETGQKTMSIATEKVYRGYVFVASVLRDKNILDAVRLGPRKEVTPDDAQKALEAIRKLFFDLRISPVFDVSEELKFVFSRRCPDEGRPCGDDDAQWKNDLAPLAA